MQDIQVSIICNTFNQCNYIADALESFLMQKTTFKYEILVHDDASTDHTAEIIKEYENRYPDIVKPIYQTENQHSKGVKITMGIQVPRAHGVYLAFCEGDDYWIDENKLQKQFEYMQKNEDCYVCAHGAYRVEADSKAILKKQVLDAGKEKYEMIDAIQGYGRNVATSSMFMRRKVFDDIPKFAWTAPCGDYVWPILAAKKGYLAYLTDIMSCYRVLAKNSYSEGWMKDSQKLQTYYQRYELMLDQINEYTQEKYVSEIERERIRIWYKYFSMVGDKRILKEEKYRKYAKSLSLRQRINNFVRVCFPKAIKKYYVIRRWFYKKRGMLRK